MLGVVGSGARVEGMVLSRGTEGVRGGLMVTACVVGLRGNVGAGGGIAGGPGGRAMPMVA